MTLFFKSLLPSNPKGIKTELYSQGTDERQNLRYEGLIIVDPKYIEISTERKEYFLRSNECRMNEFE